MQAVSYLEFVFLAQVHVVDIDICCMHLHGSRSVNAELYYTYTIAMCLYTP